MRTLLPMVFVLSERETEKSHKNRNVVHFTVLTWIDSLSVDVFFLLICDTALFIAALAYDCAFSVTYNAYSCSINVTSD